MIASALPTLRLPREKDLDELLRLEEECFVAYYAPHRFDRSQFYYYLRNPNSILSTAERPGGLTGYMLGIVSERRGRKSARLLSIAVEEDARRKGLGRELAECFLKEAKERGCASVNLEVAEEERTALHLFKKLGFKRSRVLPDYYGGGHDGVRMSRPI